MPRFRPKKEPKVSYFEQETKNEMINRWMQNTVAAMIAKDQKLRGGDIDGAEKCEKVIANNIESIIRTQEAIALLHGENTDEKYAKKLLQTLKKNLTALYNKQK